MINFLGKFSKKLVKIKGQVGDSKDQNLKKLYKLRDSVTVEFDKQLDVLYSKRDLLKEAFEQRLSLKKSLKPAWRMILLPHIKHLISAPFIYMMIIPGIILHVFLEVFHQICFSLYGIPKVKMRNYFLFDRNLLSYLNWFEKLNCTYCSYINGLFSYAREIGGRTERYWCPIKHARRRKDAHSEYGGFFDYLDGKGYRAKLKDFREFKDFKD